MKFFQSIFDSVEGIAIMGFAFLTPFLRSTRLKWGAAKAEITGPVPGDELIPDPKWGYTQATTVHTSVERIWPWLIQMGQGRGGMYSYEMIENMVGCKMHNADEIIDEFQSLSVGDSVRLHPKAGFPVVKIEPSRAIVLNYDTRTDSPASDSTNTDGFFASTLAFFLKPDGENTTRLIARFRCDYDNKQRLIYGPYLMEPVSSVMQHKMLSGLKIRAEKGNRPYSTVRNIKKAASRLN